MEEWLDGRKGGTGGAAEASLLRWVFVAVFVKSLARLDVLVEVLGFSGLDVRCEINSPIDDIAIDILSGAFVRLMRVKRLVKLQISHAQQVTLFFLACQIIGSEYILNSSHLHKATLPTNSLVF